MSALELHGVHLFSVTPTDGGGQIATHLFEAHFDRAIAAGVKSITVFGSAGAIGSFTEAERMRVAEEAIRCAAGRVPVIVGTGAMTTAECQRLSIHARKAGAAAVLVVPITYWPLTDAELLAHYRSVVEGAGLPMVLYNNPRTTGVDMPPRLLAALCDIPGVVGIKESGADVSRISETCRLNGNRVPVLTGRDPQILDALRVGAAGWFSGGANIVPKLCVDLDRHARAGAMDEAGALYERMLPLAQFAIDKGGVRVLHTALELLGRSMGAPRAPLQLLPAHESAELQRILGALPADC